MGAAGEFRACLEGDGSIILCAIQAATFLQQCLVDACCQNDAECDDANECTTDRCALDTGSCVHEDTTCEAGEVCDPATGDCGPG